MPRKKIEKKTIHKNRIRELRMARGLSAGQLAKKLGTSAPHMSRMENGVQPLSLEWLAKLSGVLKVNSNEIVDLPLTPKFASTCDNALLSSSIGWLMEAAEKQGLTLSREDLSKWSAYVYKEAVEQPLNFDQTRYLATTIVRVLASR